MSVYAAVYVLGVCAYWLQVLSVAVLNLFRRMSILDRNYAAIGTRRNLLTGAMERAAPDPTLVVVFVAVVLVLISALSWLAFAFSVVALTRQYLIALFASVPREVKEIRWSLRQALLPPEDVVRLDILAQESLLHRQLTAAEIAGMQEDFDARSIKVDIGRALGRETSSTVALNSADEA